MDFKTTYPEYADIEEHIRRARLERSVAVADAIAGLFEVIGRGLKRLADSLGDGLAAEREKRAVEADAFLRRAVAAPHR